MDDAEDLLTRTRALVADGGEAPARALLEAAGTRCAPPGGGAEPGRVRAWCRVQTALGDLERRTGDPVASETRLSSVLARAGAAFGEDDPDAVAALVALGAVHVAVRRTDDAAAAGGRALALAGPGTSAAVLAALSALLAAVEGAAGRPDRALGHAEQAVVRHAAAFGSDHPDTARERRALAALYRRTGRLAEAEAAALVALETLELRLGPGHADVGLAAAELALVRAAAGDAASAAGLAGRGLEILGRSLGPDRIGAGLTLHALGTLLSSLGDPRARPALARAHAALAPALPAGHPQLAATAAALRACPA